MTLVQPKLALVGSGECTKPLRDGPCAMQKNHRGRCSTRVFTCDACGKTRRSDPASAVYNQWDGIAEALICWFCVKADPRPVSAQEKMSRSDLDERCPRCGEDAVLVLMVGSIHGDAYQAICEVCEHRWGDGYPDSQERPLPDNYEDCRRCQAYGDLQSCRHCKGRGIVPVLQPPLQLAWGV